MAASVLAWLAWPVLHDPAWARTLKVGPAAPDHTLVDALAKAHDGDTIDLAPGKYFECGHIHQRNLTLQGAGDTTVITDRTCDGKALLVVQANGLTVRDLVLARARVPDMNGAGIRLEANGLLLERVRFINDQVGVLAGQAGGDVVVRDCTFRDGGVPGDHPTAALMIAGVGRLLVERSTFSNVKGGQISSGAARTELVGNRIETGSEPGASYAVLQTGGVLIMHDNALALGPNPTPRGAAVMAVDANVEMRANRLENTTGQAAYLLLDWSHESPVIAGNQVGAMDTEWSSEGLLGHRARGTARAALGAASLGLRALGLKALLGQ